MLGNFLAISAFFIWGCAPLYFSKIDINNIYQLMAYRILWSALLVILISYFFSFEFKSVFKINIRDVIYSALAGLVLNFSWYGFVYALTNELVLSASLAYFISPIIVIVSSCLIFNESLEKAKKIALVIMFLALFMLLLTNKEFLYLPLFISFFFSMYYIFRKKSNIKGYESIFIETLSQVPVAFLLIFFTGVNFNVQEQVIAIEVTLIQLLPVLMLSIAITKISLQKIGVMQYIEPSLHFIIGYFIFSEELAVNAAIVMFMVWLAIFVWFLPYMRKYLR